MSNTTTRRHALRQYLLAYPILLALHASAATVRAARALDMDTARERGDRKLEEMEAQLGPKYRLASGVTVREVRPGTGADTVHVDAGADGERFHANGASASPSRLRLDRELTLSWAVFRASDMYYQFGSDDARGEYLRVRRDATTTVSSDNNDNKKQGDGDGVWAPLAPGLVLGLDGMRENGIRRILVPSRLGYISAAHEPQPRGDFGSRRRLVNLRQRRADLVFEVTLVKMR